MGGSSGAGTGNRKADRGRGRARPPRGAMSGRRTGRRSSAALLTLLLVIVASLGFATQALASPVVVTSEASLDSALTSATSGETIELGASITVAQSTETVTIPTDITLNLDGYTLSTNNITIDPTYTLTVEDTSRRALGELVADPVANGYGDDAAITNTGATLVITKGTVDATSGNGAAIGGNGQIGGITPTPAQEGGNLTINGGTVNATTTGDGAAIGAGGDDGAIVGGVGGATPIDQGGTVDITGGTVSAIAGSSTVLNGGGSGAGIGGADGGNGGAVDISGGTVTAQGGVVYGIGANVDYYDKGAGIGGSSIGTGVSTNSALDNGGSAGTVDITGGTVTATGVTGIGGGYGGDGGEVTIGAGATVTAEGNFGSDVGAGNGNDGENGPTDQGTGAGDADAFGTLDVAGTLVLAQNTNLFVPADGTVDVESTGLITSETGGDGGTEIGPATGTDNAGTIDNGGVIQAIDVDDVLASAGGLTVTGNDYPITFDDNEAANNPANTTLYVYAPTFGAAWISPPNPVVSGQTLTGWNTEADGSGTTITSSSVLSGPETLYAQWEQDVVLPSDELSGSFPVGGNACECSAATQVPQDAQISYQWLLNGAPISGATSVILFGIPASYLGDYLSVQVTGTAVGYGTATETSNQIVVTPGTLTPRTPTISGTDVAGDTLTASTTAWSPSGVSLSYQWLDDGQPISGATSSTYALAGSDVGNTVSVQVTGALAGYTTESETSTATPTIAGGTQTAGTPTISGAPTAGQTLTASPGAWSPGGDTFTYQWESDGSPINGATASTYTLTGTDVGNTISVQVTGTLTGYTSASATSSATSAIADATLATGTPLVFGSEEVGQTLAAFPGTWEPSDVTLAYQWVRDGQPIDGATAANYTLTGADAGHQISVQVTGTLPGYTSASASSTPTVAVVAGNLTAAIPTITGNSAVGQTLTASPGTWSPSAVSFAYQWERDGQPIAGATSNSYVLTPADAGEPISVQVTGALLGYTNGSATSAPTPAVAQPPAAIFGTVTVSVSGIAKFGKTLAATVSGAPGASLSYRWYRGSAAISNATASAYRLTTADVGQPISVEVTATASGYAPAMASSSSVTVAKDRATLSLSVPAVLKAGHRATIRVTLDHGASGIKPVGAVTVYYNSDQKRITVTDHSGTVLTVTLPNLAAGTYALHATYGGSSRYAPSSTKTVIRKAG
jgi:hypothetical protein